MDLTPVAYTYDSNRDGTLDACQNPPDEDGDGISDWQQIALDPSLDCNGNWRLDAVEIAMFDVWDSNSNGIPDDCERAMLPAETVFASTPST